MALPLTTMRFGPLSCADARSPAVIQLLKKLLLTALIVAQLRATVRASGVEAKIRLREDSFSTIRGPSGLSWSRIGG
jgi:hypothetical protein